MNNYQKRKKTALHYLGSQCQGCGARECLEFDHIDPKDKHFTISQKMCASWKMLKKELDKCQLLCRPCHFKKHHKGEARHGTSGMYTNHGCRCTECRINWNAYMKVKKPLYRQRALASQ